MIAAFDELEKKAIQHLILDEETRPDGRGIHQIRDITTRVGVLPRTHGSALFYARCDASFNSRHIGLAISGVIHSKYVR